MISKTSTGINFLGIPLAISYVKEAIEKFPDNPIYSIGSGGGYLEYILDRLLHIDIICVDPDPLSYITDKTIFKNPKYLTIDDEDFPKEINNSILLINWSTPEQCNGYDIQAVIKLKPCAIIFIGETGFYRGAGSIGFHDFLNFNNIQTQGLYNPELDECIKPNQIDMSDLIYFKNAETICNYRRPGFDMYNRFSIILLSKNNYVALSLPSYVYPYDSRENRSDTADQLWINIRNTWESQISLLEIPKLNQQVIARVTREHSHNKKMSAVSIPKKTKEEIDKSWSDYIDEIFKMKLGKK